MTIAINRFSKSDYEIYDTYVAGLELQGWEVKSLRQHNVNLKNAYCYFKKQELFVFNMIISSWMLQKNDESRNRKLLLKKSELKKIFEMQKKLNLIIIPLKIFFIKDKIKMEIAIAKRLNKIDKRQKIIELEQKRKIKNYL